MKNKERIQASKKRERRLKGNKGNKRKRECLYATKENEIRGDFISGDHRLSFSIGVWNYSIATAILLDRIHTAIERNSIHKLSYSLLFLLPSILPIEFNQIQTLLERIGIEILPQPRDRDSYSFNITRFGNIVPVQLTAIVDSPALPCNAML